MSTASETGYTDESTKEVDAEVQAIAEAWEALRSLGSDGQQRAINWLTDRFGLNGAPS